MKPILNAYREAVTESQLGPEIESAIEQVSSLKAYTVDGERYKRIPHGFVIREYIPNHREAALKT